MITPGSAEPNPFSGALHRADAADFAAHPMQFEEIDGDVVFTGMVPHKPEPMPHGDPTADYGLSDRLADATDRTVPPGLTRPVVGLALDATVQAEAVPAAETTRIGLPATRLPRDQAIIDRVAAEMGQGTHRLAGPAAPRERVITNFRAGTRTVRKNGRQVVIPLLEGTRQDGTTNSTLLERALEDLDKGLGRPIPRRSTKAPLKGRVIKASERRGPKIQF